MEVTLCGMVMVLRDVQPWNPSESMKVTLSGMVTWPLASGVIIQSPLTPYGCIEQISVTQDFNICDAMSRTCCTYGGYGSPLPPSRVKTSRATSNRRTVMSNRF